MHAQHLSIRADVDAAARGVVRARGVERLARG
jgi:hypothetical protein